MLIYKLFSKKKLIDESAYFTQHRKHLSIVLKNMQMRLINNEINCFNFLD